MYKVLETASETGIKVIVEITEQTRKAIEAITPMLLDVGEEVAKTVWKEGLIISDNIAKLTYKNIRSGISAIFGKNNTPNQNSNEK